MPSHPSSRQAHPISSQRLPSRQWVSKDKTGLATWCKEVTIKVKMEVVEKPSTLVGTTFRFLTSVSSRWLAAWSEQRAAIWSASFRSAPRTCHKSPRLSSLDSGARALASRRDLNKRNQKNPCICASVLAFTNNTCSRVTRSSNCFWTSTKSSRSTVKEPEKTFDPQTVEVFSRSRSLRPWRAVGRKFNRCTTLIKLTLQLKGSSNLSNRTTATRIPETCSNPTTHSNICHAVMLSSSQWCNKFQATMKNKTRHLATSSLWAQALTCPCKCLCQWTAIILKTSSIEIACHFLAPRDTLQSQVIDTDWLHFRVNQPQPWSKRSSHSRQKDPSNRWIAWHIWWIGRHNLHNGWCILIGLQKHSDWIQLAWHYNKQRVQRVIVMNDDNLDWIN